MRRAYRLQGQSLQYLANALGVSLPKKRGHPKGLVGQMLESYLGADAGNQARPDFTGLGIELKSISLNTSGKPTTATFVSGVPSHIRKFPEWEESSVCKKLQRVLWIPIEMVNGEPMSMSRIGTPILWSPDEHTVGLLRQDWEELIELVCLARFDSIHAGLGAYLQLRPRTGERATQGQPHPLSFYLRAKFTEQFIINPARSCPS